MKLNKNKLKDSRGRPLTQSLFLEIGYNTKFAVYTLKDEDYEYKGVIYPSLKVLYLDAEDPIEYLFANQYLLGWEHWKRICANKLLNKYIEVWREELELKLRSQATKDIINQSVGDKGYQAAKWVADKGWYKRAPGRPSKLEIDKEKSIQAQIDEEYAHDIERLDS